MRKVARNGLIYFVYNKIHYKTRGDLLPVGLLLIGFVFAQFSNIMLC